jgi:hypothetical protein
MRRRKLDSCATSCHDLFKNAQTFDPVLQRRAKMGRRLRRENQNRLFQKCPDLSLLDYFVGVWALTGGEHCHRV